LGSQRSPDPLAGFGRKGRERRNGGREGEGKEEGRGRGRGREGVEEGGFVPSS